MSLALVQSRALMGLQASGVTVEVHLANGLPSFTLVGSAVVEGQEARKRGCRAIVGMQKEKSKLGRTSATARQSKLN